MRSQEEQAHSTQMAPESRIPNRDSRVVSSITTSYAPVPRIMCKYTRDEAKRMANITGVYTLIEGIKTFYSI